MAGTLTAATIDSGAASTAPTFSANGTQIGTLCRAWCKFDGTLTGTNAPTQGFNVTSVTRSAAGNYTVNFTNAMPDANYAVAWGAGTSGTVFDGDTMASSSYSFQTKNTSNTNADSTYVCISVFR